MKNNNCSVLIKTSPSLALIKYWGKMPNKYNIPATTSLAVTLQGLRTETLMIRDGSGKLIVQENNDAARIEQSLTDYIGILNRYSHISFMPDAYSINNFPTAAGIASSSSGYAALALGLLAFETQKTNQGALLKSCLNEKQFLQKASRLARIGSVSASRAVYEGFTLLQRGAQRAEQLAPASFWSSLRILIVIVSTRKKAVSSRNGMKLTEQTSPYYKAWIHDAKKLSQEALSAFEHKDLEKLGACMRASYLRMHASAIAAGTPIIYWYPESLAVLHCAEALRKEGYSVWETMDAGPQVKLIYEEHEEQQISARLKAMLEEYGICNNENFRFVFSRPGGQPELYYPDEAEQQAFLEQFKHYMQV